MKRELFLKTVRDYIAEDPEAAGELIGAVTQGLTESVRRTSRQLAVKNMALGCALSLVKPGRMTEATKAQLNRVVCRGILIDCPQESLTQSEREFLESCPK